MQIYTIIEYKLLFFAEFDSYDLLCIDNLYEVVYIEEEGTFAFKSLDKVDNYEPFVNLLEAYVVGNKFDKEK